jgi:hypothetical protein
MLIADGNRNLHVPTIKRNCWDLELCAGRTSPPPPPIFFARIFAIGAPPPGVDRRATAEKVQKFYKSTDFHCFN